MLSLSSELAVDQMLDDSCWSDLLAAITSSNLLAALLGVSTCDHNFPFQHPLGRI